MPAPQSAPAAETGRVLIIDDDDVILEFVRVSLEEDMPGVTVTTYNSRQNGRPGADFDWTAHDLLLLDYDLGGGQTGTDWLRQFAGKPGFPHTILLSADKSATMVGNAIRQGAAGYLNKAELNPDRLVDAVREALTTIASVDSAMPKQAPTPGQNASSAGSSTGFKNKESLDTGPGGANYRFIRIIGRGAMSRVYLAERSEDQMTLVLKILARDVARDPENVLRFAREGELISRVDSPYVVKVYDHGTTNSYGYIAMEFFGRGDLAQVIEQGVSPDDAVIYLHNIACGLKAIHEAGIVHRDLKPGNIMLRGDGSMAIADFGLSKRIGLDSSLTQTGVILGTPYCMSPEQTDGLEADHRSDLYAAGVMFYEMLMGERPFNASNLPALLMAIQKDPIPRLPESMARYQPMVDRLLAKDPDDRFQTAGELVSALRALANPT